MLKKEHRQQHPLQIKNLNPKSEGRAVVMDSVRRPHKQHKLQAGEFDSATLTDISSLQ